MKKEVKEILDNEEIRNLATIKLWLMELVNIPKDISIEMLIRISIPMLVHFLTEYPKVKSVKDQQIAEMILFYGEHK